MPVSVLVSAVNDAPVNTVPTAQTVNEDTDLVFSAANGNAISVADVDVGGLPVEVTLSATNGVLSLAGTTGLTFTTGHGTADATLVFSGARTDVNAALATLVYRPATNFHGSALLTITASDQGGSGFGGALSDTGTVPISVVSVNDTPTDITLTGATIAENAASGTTVGMLSTADVDAGDTFTYVLVSGTGDTDNAAFTLVGGSLKTAASFDFETKASYTIRIRAADAGGLSFEKALVISVTDVNEAPVSVALANTTTNVIENTNTATRIKVADIVFTDDALGSETVTLTGADASSFEVDGLALYLRAGVALDRETKASYTVTVNVADTSVSGSVPVA
ncbi:MAG: cadherin repeat domain-containing protein, partial [Actinobacteria bacterium]|nr:cadherin repeat domain-containing protein [Actinomycetota bacterium]